MQLFVSADSGGIALARAQGSVDMEMPWAQETENGQAYSIVNSPPCKE